MTVPSTPGGTLSELSFTSLAFSPKIAVSSFSSGESSVSPFGRDLADQDITGLHAGADTNDATLVEVHERLFSDVRDLDRDLLGASLRVSNVKFELLDVHGREDVVLDECLADDDRVLEVVTVPRHEGHGDVPAERQCTEVGGRAVRDHLARLHHLPGLHDRALVDRRVLVGAPELLQPVSVVLRQPGQGLVLLRSLRAPVSITISSR